ncbi:alpha/beta hydrolase [Alcanivorax sp. JB21]|uniref:alpha/beta fold hydrolase n=1 Tax=Alcanivorax limicola TaxID=2874102 RepID=UPI001CBEBD3A|nr:alpha/beta hydrolase [Alcanivorax limicola]MBZ2187706.1 alpha/beta hydrolase [Alcanivorax limicola]
MKYSLEAWRKLGHFANLHGQQIFVIDTLQRDPAAHHKPVLLLVHGYPTSSWDFNLILDELCRDFRVVVPDLLGLGFSAKPYPHHYNMAEQASIVEATLAHCDVQQCHVLAHDYGDTVVQEMLARDNAKPQSRYLSVALLNGGLFPETHLARPMQKLMASRLGPLLARLTSRGKLLKTFCSVFGASTQPSEEELEAVWQLVNHNQGLRCLPPLLGYIRERRQHRSRWVGALTDTRVPLAVINGSADPVSGAHMVARFRELVGAQHFIRELADIGHYPHMEAPAATLGAWQAFIAQLPSNQSTARE